MDYSTFKRDKLAKYFTKSGLYLIGIPNSQTHQTQSDRVVLRSGSLSAQNLKSGTPLYKLGLAAGSRGVQGRLGDYATALPNGFKIFGICEKRACDVRKHEKQVHDWLGKMGLRYNRFGDANGTVSRTEWGGAALTDFKVKLLTDHVGSGSSPCPFVWFSDKDAVILNGKYKGRTLKDLISKDLVRPSHSKKALDPDKEYLP